jgi:RHS repeat-associated protein
LPYPTAAARSSGHGVTSRYTYRPNSSLLAETIQTRDSDGVELLRHNRVYDNLRRLTSINAVRGGDAAVLTRHAYTYNDANQRVAAQMEDGSRWDWDYDDLGQVTGANRSWAGGQPAAGQQFAFEYDDIGNRVTSAEGGNAQGQGARLSQYQSNLLNQYESRVVPPVAAVSGEAAADAEVTLNGQSVTRQNHGQPGKLYYYGELGVDNTTEPAYPLLEIEARQAGAGEEGTDAVAIEEGHQYIPATPEQFAYDADGNMLSDGRWSYGWNGENRLITRETLAQAVAAGAPRERFEYLYDSTGRRVLRRAYTWDGATAGWVLQQELRFLYDGWNLLAEVDATLAPHRTYTWGQDLSGTLQGAGGVGGLLTFHGHTPKTQIASTTHLYAYDGNGNITTLVDSATADVTARFTYGPFGQTLQATGVAAGSEVQPFGFSTKYVEGYGLTYYGYRYYSAIFARWLRRDPIGESGGAHFTRLLIMSPCPKQITWACTNPVAGHLGTNLRMIRNVLK